MEEIYRRALYRVEADVAFELRIGQYSESLNALFIDARHRSAAFLTACNPLGVKISDTDNRHAQHRLATEIRQIGLPSVQAIGLDSDSSSSWPGEPSELVLGISKQDAIRLGIQFRQLAIVWCPSSAIPQLLMLNNANLRLKKR